MITGEERIEQLLKRIEQAIYQLQYTTARESRSDLTSTPPEVSVSANLRIEDALDVNLVPTQSVVFGVMTLAPNETMLIRPEENEHWLLHAIYHTQSCAIDRVYSDTSSIDGVLTNPDAGVIIGWELLLRKDYYLRVRNTGSADGTFLYEARRLNL